MSHACIGIAGGELWRELDHETQCTDGSRRLAAFATIPKNTSSSASAAMPLLMVVVSPANALVPIVAAASLGFLALLGAIGAKAGGANIWRATLRVTFWCALALGITAGIGKLFGTIV